MRLPDADDQRATSLFPTSLGDFASRSQENHAHGAKIASPSTREAERSVGDYRFPVDTGFFLVGGHAYARLPGGQWFAVNEDGLLERIRGAAMTTLFSMMSANRRFITRGEFLRHVAPGAQIPDELRTSAV